MRTDVGQTKGRQARHDPFQRETPVAEVRIACSGGCCVVAWAFGCCATGLPAWRNDTD